MCTSLSPLQTQNVLPVLTMNGLVDCRMQLIFLHRIQLLRMSATAAVDWRLPTGITQPSQLFTSSVPVRNVPVLPEKSTSFSAFSNNTVPYSTVQHQCLTYYRYFGDHLSNKSPDQCKKSDLHQIKL